MTGKEIKEHVARYMKVFENNNIKPHLIVVNQSMIHQVKSQCLDVLDPSVRKLYINHGLEGFMYSLPVYRTDASEDIHVLSPIMVF